MRGFGLGKSWRTGSTGNTQYNTSGTFVAPFGKQFTQISGAGVPGTPASYYAGAPAIYYAGVPSSYYAGAPASYYAGTSPSYYAGAPSSYYAGNYINNGPVLYVYVTAFYNDPTPYAVFADGNIPECPPNTNYYYTTPGAYTYWTCTPVKGPGTYYPASYIPAIPASYNPGNPSSYTPANPASYYAGDPPNYTPASPASYYAGATGPNNTILGVTFPGGTAGNPGAYVNPTTIDTDYIYVYPNSYAIPNLSGGYVIISVN